MVGKLATRRVNTIFGSTWLEVKTFIRGDIMRKDVIVFDNPRINRKMISHLDDMMVAMFTGLMTTVLFTSSD